jgi:glycerol kinase
MVKDVLVAVDIGTSSCKILAFDLQGHRLAFGQGRYQNSFADDGQAEQDPDRWWSAFLATFRAAGIHDLSDRIAGLAVTSLRAAVLPIDNSGRALSCASLAHDQRARDELSFLRTRITDEEIYFRTGLRPNSYFSLPRMLWYRNHKPELYPLTSKFVSAQDYVIRKLCGRVVTDRSHASRSMCFNIHQREWDAEILAKVGLPLSLLAELVDPGDCVGKVSRSVSDALGLPQVPIIAAGGDQMCAAVGMGILEDTSVSINHGTGSFIESPRRLITLDQGKRHLCSIHVLPKQWIIEFPLLATGRLVEEFIANVFGLGIDPEQVYARAFQLARDRPHKGSLLFLPFQAGSTAPHWCPELSGIISGLRSSHDRFDLIRSLIEGIVIEIKRCVSVLSVSPKEIVVAGGLSRHPEFNQIQADIYNVPVIPTREVEATALGAAIVAAVGLGLHPTFSDAVNNMVSRECADTKYPIEGNREYFSEIFHLQDNVLRFALEQCN